jgi:hypothetical protein|tara:strand:- start:215 stop:436 length:222 start_codon:yes stop_codon:yes gene_type:complete
LILVEYNFSDIFTLRKGNMDQRKKNLIRLTSILLVLVVVLEKLEVIHLDIFSNNGAFWVLIAAYAMVVITLKK